MGIASANVCLTTNVFECFHHPYFHDNSASAPSNERCSVEIPTYDIFSGSAPQDAMWLEAVEGLDAACEKMKEHAKKSPGAYFVFCQNTHKVLANINTRISEDIQIRESA